MKLVVLAIMLASAPAHADSEDPFDGGTITAQAGIGGVTGLLAGGTLGLIGAGAGMVLNPRNIGTPIVGALLGFATGAAIGVVWGVDYAGDDRGANGSLLGTGLGFVVGAGAWVGMQVIVDRTGHDMPTSGAVLTGILTCIGGPIIGYHLTADSKGQNKRISVPVVGFVF